MAEDYPTRRLAAQRLHGQCMESQKPLLPSEALLDAAVEYTFPASDPISIDHAFSAARERETAPADSDE